MALRWLHRDADFGAVTLVDDGGALDLARVHHFFARVFWEAAEAGATSVHGAGGGGMAAGATAPAIVFRAKGLLHIAGSGVRTRCRRSTRRTSSSRRTLGPTATSGSTASSSSATGFARVNCVPRSPRVERLS